MKNRIFLFCLLAALAISCVKDQQEVIQTITDDPVFYATIEEPGNPVTRVFADNQLRVLWNADDRVSIFNKSTYNRQYRFDGQDGDNSGAFKVVPSDDFVTSNPLDYVYSVYPYNANSKISNDGEITVYLPAEQFYREDSFGLGANTMVAVTQGDELMFKNLCGYFAIKLYGDNVSVSSITLKGNNNEPLAGKATVVAQTDAALTLQMDPTEATKELTITCATPVTLGSTAETATTFWFVIPPTTFANGFTLTVNDGSGGTFVKTTTGSLVIKRNVLKKSAALEVVIENCQPNNVIYYTSSDEKIITPSNPDVFGANIVSNEYVDGKGVITFDGEVTSIGDHAFSVCTGLTSFEIPNSVTSIGDYAFEACYGLWLIGIPNSVTSIGLGAFEACSGLVLVGIPNSVTSIKEYTFKGCENLKSAVIPNSVLSIGNYAFKNCFGLGEIILSSSVTSIGTGAFANCNHLSSIEIPKSVTSIGQNPFSGCYNLESISVDPGNLNYDSRDNCNAIINTQTGELITGCNNTNIPSSVTEIGDAAFSDCRGLTSIEIPKSVTSIGNYAFFYCGSLTSITVLAATPPTLGSNAFMGTGDCPIYVPAASLEAYKAAENWSDYADRIQAIPSPSVPIPEAVDLGLPSGLKWASFNIGASAPEDYGDYYAWGETEPKADYSWETYKWCLDSHAFTKYCSNSQMGYNGFTDGKTVLDTEDDAAHVNLGGGWRIPRNDEWAELRNNCTWIWTTQNGVYGRMVTGPNGNSIFIPAVGYGIDTDRLEYGLYGRYWSSSLDTNYPSSAIEAYFSSGDVLESGNYRCYGLPVRPVYEYVSVELVCLKSYLTLSERRNEKALTATVLPPKASNKRMTWSSSDESVATVSPGGVIKGVSKGTAIITVTTEDGGKSASCRVTVVESEMPIPEAVDLGLPSGLKWASFNLGASKPEGYGDYYAWGETDPEYDSLDPLTWKEGKIHPYSFYPATSYEWGVALFTTTNDYTITKYCCGDNSWAGFVDGKTVLDPEDDAASDHLGGKWRMPTNAEWKELSETCTWNWASVNGVNGRLVTGVNGNSIFLPAAGTFLGDSIEYRHDSSYYTTESGYYWSSSLDTDPYCASDMSFKSNEVKRNSARRVFGLTVRPVTE